MSTVNAMKNKLFRRALCNVSQKSLFYASQDWRSIIMREEKIPRNNVLITTLASNKNTHHLPCFCNNIIQNERIIKRSTMRLKFNLLIGTLLCFKFTSGNVVECPDPNAAPVEVDGKCTLISFVSNVFYRRFLASSDSRTFIVLFYFVLFCLPCLSCIYLHLWYNL
jgi:hypothetical protein